MVKAEGDEQPNPSPWHCFQRQKSLELDLTPKDQGSKKVPGNRRKGSSTALRIPHAQREFGMRRPGLQATKHHILLGMGKTSGGGAIARGEQRRANHLCSQGKQTHICHDFVF